MINEIEWRKNIKREFDGVCEELEKNIPEFIELNNRVESILKKRRSLLTQATVFDNAGNMQEQLKLAYEYDRAMIEYNIYRPLIELGFLTALSLLQSVVRQYMDRMMPNTKTLVKEMVERMIKIRTTLYDSIISPTASTYLLPEYIRCRNDHDYRLKTLAATLSPLVMKL